MKFDYLIKYKCNECRKKVHYSKIIFLTNYNDESITVCHKCFSVNYRILENSSITLKEIQSTTPWDTLKLISLGNR